MRVAYHSLLLSLLVGVCLLLLDALVRLHVGHVESGLLIAGLVVVLSFGRLGAKGA